MRLNDEMTYCHKTSRQSQHSIRNRMSNIYDSISYLKTLLMYFRHTYVQKTYCWFQSITPTWIMIMMILLEAHFGNQKYLTVYHTPQLVLLVTYMPTCIWILAEGIIYECNSTASHCNSYEWKTCTARLQTHSMHHTALHLICIRHKLLTHAFVWSMLEDFFSSFQGIKAHGVAHSHSWLILFEYLKVKPPTTLFPPITKYTEIVFSMCTHIVHIVELHPFKCV